MMVAGSPSACSPRLRHAEEGTSFKRSAKSEGRSGLAARAAVVVGCAALAVFAFVALPRRGAAAPGASPRMLHAAEHQSSSNSSGNSSSSNSSKSGNSSTHNGPPFGHPSPTKEYPKKDGFTLWLVEEFDEPLDLDTDPIWTWSDGGLKEGIVRFVKDGIKFQDGKMWLEVAEDGRHQGAACSHAEVGYPGQKRLTSGEIRTRWNIFRYGIYETSMKAASVQPGNPWVDGNYISTMFVYRAAKFKHWREIDIEVLGGWPNNVQTNVLHADGTGEWGYWMQDEAHTKWGEGWNARAQFHEYAFVWLPTHITWYLDGVKVRDHWQGGRIAVPDLSTKIMMSLWVFNGADFGGKKPWNNQYPMHSEYDWFRFYKWDQDEEYPCMAMNETCLRRDDDLYLAGNNPCDGIPQKGLLFGQVPCTATCEEARR